MKTIRINTETENTTTVTVETMPDWLRDSHRAAGNWGQYPSNGAVRQRVEIGEAEELVESDDDGYNKII
jgi:hypothetical protein